MGETLLYLLKLKWASYLQKCKKIDSLRAINGAPPCIPVSDKSLLTPATLPIFRDANSRNDTRLRIFSGTANPSLSQVSFIEHEEIMAMFFFLLML